jgi:hypothetical protein
MSSSQTKASAFWICAIITTLNAAVSVGFSLPRLLGPENGEVALYAASRSSALLLVVLGVVWLRSRAGLAALAFAMSLVQAFDTGIGILDHNPGKTFGPMAFAVATFVSVSFLLREMAARPASSGEPE